MRIFILFLLLLNYSASVSQNKFKQFKKLSGPEKRWVLFHPFIAKSCWELTLEARKTTDIVRNQSLLDTFQSGGKLDAFRHAYWMALITQKHPIKKALSLGKAHENGNYKQYKRLQKEEGEVPDAASTEMDLWNNKIGALIGLLNRNSGQQILQTQIIEAILKGEMKIIKRNKQGRYINAKDEEIPFNELIKWENPKELGPSNFIF